MTRLAAGTLAYSHDRHLPQRSCARAALQAMGLRLAVQPLAPR